MKWENGVVSFGDWIFQKAKKENFAARSTSKNKNQLRFVENIYVLGMNANPLFLCTTYSIPKDP
jgi:predicted membrane-bound spermidine synthase